MTGSPRVAFFGGSFDPPHRGHIAVARAAQTALALDTVLFAPVGAQPLKPAGSTATFDDRVAMTRLAIANDPAFELSLLDAPKNAPASKPNYIPNYTPNYTFDTLQTLRATLPPAADLFCLLGADSFVALRRWHRGAEIPFAAALIVAARPGESLRNIAELLPAGLTLDAPPAPIPAPANIDLLRTTLRNPAGAAAPFYLLPGLDIPISASAIRRQIHAAERAPDTSTALAPAVLDYIATHHLYGLSS